MHISRTYTALYTIDEGPQEVRVREIVPIEKAHKRYGHRLSLPPNKATLTDDELNIARKAISDLFDEVREDLSEEEPGLETR